MQILPQLFREKRQSLKITQKQVAQALGCSLSHIKNIEYGRVNVSYETFLKLCHALGQEPQITLHPMQKATTQ